VGQRSSALRQLRAAVLASATTTAARCPLRKTLSKLIRENVPPHEFGTHRAVPRRASHQQSEPNQYTFETWLP
jgi:hypothetical protein